MDALRLDLETAKRMGYDGIVASESLESGGLKTEICLISPGAMSNTKYSIAVHQDCDPNDPSRGTSVMDTAGETIEEATAAYETWLSEIRSSLGLPLTPPTP